MALLTRKVITMSILTYRNDLRLTQTWTVG